jgi:serine phosphatase RsbU (regulator of sigma subunit)
VLAYAAASVYHSNEHRLLNLRARAVGAVLAGAVTEIQTPLASAAALADATHGNPQKFKRLIAPYIGLGGTRPFVSVSLWRVRDPQAGPVAVLGSPPMLHTAMGQAAGFFSRASNSTSLTVLDLLQAPEPRIGYGYTGRVAGPYAAYGESALKKSRYTPVGKNSGFADINFAIYLGAPSPSTLLATSVRHLPLTGRRVSVRVPFGTSQLTVDVAPHGSLSGSLPQRLPVILAVVGALLTLGATALTVRLIERRRHAEALALELESAAEENRRLYAEQRTIAQTLQHALLPEQLPQLPGLQTGARYEAGVQGVEIGGDWYDLIELDAGQLLLVVGDVSGRGLRAASAMAALRYAIHAYAAQGDPPGEFLRKLSKLVNVRSTGQIATVLCAVIDVRAHELSLTSAGHLPPLLIGGRGSEFLITEPGLPVGVDQSARYPTTRVTAPAGSTLLAFTDGLVERRGENIDLGLERLRGRAGAAHDSLDELLDRLVRDLREDGSEDDTAIAGIRWTS